MNKITKDWFVYIIKSTDDSLYTGITTDIERRWNEHNGISKGAKGAKYFRGRKPQALLFISKHVDRSTATRVEMKIKRTKRKDKLELIGSTQNEINEYQFSLPSNCFES